MGDYKRGLPVTKGKNCYVAWYGNTAYCCHLL